MEFVRPTAALCRPFRTFRRVACVGGIVSFSCHSAPGARGDASAAVTHHDEEPVVQLSAAAIRVENLAPGLFAVHNTAEVLVRSTAHLERADAGSSAPGLEFLLANSCGQPVSPCMKLSPKSVLVPVGLNSGVCTRQCADECDPSWQIGGSYRLVLTACENTSVRYEGPLFTMPATPAGTARTQAAASAESGTAQRLDSGSQAMVTGASATLDGRVLRRIAAWLENAENFVDGRLRRCKSGMTLGVVLSRTLPDATSDRSELALDFACNRLVLVRAQGGVRRETASLFDASRAEALSLARIALPNDPEIARLTP